jgi:hypothetical protein
MFPSCATLPDRLCKLSAEDYLSLRSIDRLHLVTWLKQEKWQEVYQFAATLAAQN